MQDEVVGHGPARLITVDAGLCEYREALARQHELHARVVAGEAAAFLMFVQHPPVLTLGRNADRKFLGFAESWFKAQGVDIVPIDRGGEVTAHEPGQLVMYPILRLADFRLMPRSYVCLLEDAVIATLAAFGVEAARDAAYPGVWVDGGARKICAVGTRIKDRATLHGIALNVDNGLDLFAKIVPCGIQGRGVTSLARELAARGVAAPGVAEVQATLVREMQARLMTRVAGAGISGGLRWSCEDSIISC